MPAVRFGDVEAARRVGRRELSDPLEVLRERQLGRAGALLADEAAIERLRRAARPAAKTEVRRVKRARINNIAPSAPGQGLTVVYHGLDTYIANLVGGELRADFMELLPMAQEDAKTMDGLGVALSPFPPFLGQNLGIKPNGGGTFAFFCMNADVTVKIRRPKHAPSLAAAQVQLSAACLHRLGYVQALEELAAWVKVWFPVGHLQPSRVDLNADTQGWQPTLDDISQAAFITPCSAAYMVCKGAVIESLRYGTGGQVGSRSGAAPIQLAIYDKTEEIRVHDKGWFVPLWAANPEYVDRQTVYRIEARFTREYLKARQIESQGDLLASLGALWREALEWCRYTVPQHKEGREHRERWQTRPEWGTLAALQWGEVPPRVISRTDQAQPKLERVLAALGGQLVSLGALFAGIMDADVSEAVTLAVPALLRRWDERGESFTEKVCARALRFGGVGIGMGDAGLAPC
jgi:muconolactone delta-isomerase